MAVIRVEKNKNYTVMSNVHLRDKALSLKAKGLLSLILSLPDDWQYNVKGLAAISKEGRSGITSGLQELEAAGYLERRQLRGEHGKLAQVEYVVFEAPRPPLAENPATAKPATADPATENPVTGKPVTEDRAQISTEEQITEKQNIPSEENSEQTILPGVLLLKKPQNDAGHTHDDSCYDADGALICGETERDAVTEEAAPAHVHTDDCYTLTLTCQKEEHKHDDTCFSNPNADVETASAWEATLPQKLTGNWAEDVLAIAESQLGYTESQKNYQVVNGRHKGYSRYGAWYGDPYGDWCAMFVSFCLRYAQVDAKLMPIDANCASWIRQLDKLEIYHETYNALNEAQRAARLEELRAALAEQGRTDEAAALEALPAYLPAPGDLIFFDWEADGVSDHIGLVYELLDAHGKSITAALAQAESEEALAAAQAMEPAQVRTIEGNASDRVQYVTYALDSAKIAGYGTLPENPDPVETDTLPEAAEETEAPEEPVPADGRPRAPRPGEGRACPHHDGADDYGQRIEIFDRTQR